MNYIVKTVPYCNVFYHLSTYILICFIVFYHDVHMFLFLGTFGTNWKPSIQRTQYLMVAMIIIRGGSRTAATSKMERFVIIVNDFQLSAPSWMLQAGSVVVSLKPDLSKVRNKFNNFFIFHLPVCSFPFSS